MNELAVFQYQGLEVRVVQDEQGEPWFVARDVCDILGLSNDRDAISRLSATMKGVATADTLGGPQQVNTISEAGVYKLVFTSRKPEAEAFTDWVAGEVIPSIRKHGAYMTPETIEKVLLNPDTIITLATNLKEEIAKRQKLEAEKKVMLPKVDAYETLMAATNTISIGDLAKTIKHTPAIGRTYLFRFLRDMNILQSNNLPYQLYRDRGYFEVIAVPKQGFAGEPIIFEQTRVTPKGIDFVQRMVAKHFDDWRRERAA